MTFYLIRGNIVGAGAVAVVFVLMFGWMTGGPLLAAGAAASLASNLHPLKSGTLFYAGVEGVWVAVAVASIGFITFVVSFGLTLAVAVNARRLAGVDWRRGHRQVFDRFRANKLACLIPNLRPARAKRLGPGEPMPFGGSACAPRGEGRQRS